MTNFLKNIFFLFINLIFGRRLSKASILMYHSVENGNSFLTIRPQTFEKQIKYLKDKNFNIVRLSDLVGCLKLGKSIAKMVVITFDDGYENFYYNAWPILKRYNVPATVFIPTGLLGNFFSTSDGLAWPVMTRTMIQQIASEGLIDFFPHTRTHADLSKSTPEFLIQEIEGSRKDLESFLPKQIISLFAYPKGRFNISVVDYLKNNKWDGAVGVQGGLVSGQSNIYNLARNGVGEKTSFVHFRLLVTDGLGFFTSFKRLLGITK